MSEPNNLITQVSKDDSKLLQDNQNIKVTVPEPYSQNANTSHNNSNNNDGGGSGSFLSKLFCCCFKPKAQSSTTNNNKDNVDLAETYLLPPLSPDMRGKKTLLLDLDETLVHSSFKPIPNPDFIVPVEIEEQIHKVYVLKRPHVDHFLQKLGPQFEIVVFTASLAKYADPVLDLLDIHKVVKYRLFRESCSNYKGNYVKDLSRIGRSLNDSMIIDNSPASYLFHPENAIPIESWFDDESDHELLDMIPFLESLTKVENVRVPIEQAKLKNGKFTL